MSWFDTVGDVVKKAISSKMPFNKAQGLLRGDEDAMDDPQGMFASDAAPQQAAPPPGIPSYMRPMGRGSPIQGINPEEDALGSSMHTTPPQMASDRNIPSLETALGVNKKAGWGDIIGNAMSIFIPSLATGIARSKSGDYGGFSGGMAEGLAQSFPQFVNRQMESKREQRLENKEAMSDPARIAAYNQARKRAIDNDPMFASGKKSFDDMLMEEFANLKQQQAQADVAHKLYGTTGYGLYQRLMDEGRPEDAQKILDTMMQTSARGELGTILARTPGMTPAGALDLRESTKDKYRHPTTADAENKYLEAQQRAASGQPQPGDAAIISAYELLQAKKPGGRRRSGGGGESIDLPLK